MLRKFNEENVVKFTECLRDTSWDLVFCSTDPNIILENFYIIFNASFNKYFPLKVVKHKKDIVSKPYITYEIRQLIKEKHKLQRKFAKYPLSYGDQYRQLRNRVTQKLRIAEANYYKSQLDQNKGNSKKTWQTINSLLNRSSNTTLPEKNKHKFGPTNNKKGNCQPF